MKYHNDPILALAKSLGLTPKRVQIILAHSSFPPSAVREIIKTIMGSSYTISQDMPTMTKKLEVIRESLFSEIKEKYLNVFEKNSQCAFLYSVAVQGRRFDPEIEKNMFLSGSNNSSWLLEYWNVFFKEEETLPENQHNFMVVASDVYSKEYLESSRKRIENNQDIKNTKLVCDAFQNFFKTNELTKDIPKNQIERIISKLVNFS